VDTDATLSAVRDIIANHDRIYAILWGTTERDPQNLVENTLNTEAFEIDSRWFGNVRLVRYVSPQTMGETVESGAIFGDSITLESYALSKPHTQPIYYPGDTLQLRLDWQTSASIPRRYKIFVQLLSPDGVLVSQRDSEPGGGLKPIDSWTPEEVVADNHAIIIPDDLTPAHYRLIIGFYNPDNSAERLPLTINGTAEATNYLTLETITIEARRD
ncbi:MAG TPA: hypothetical protein VHL11_05735, partial [Phototrophicaceae bacterium]|nr:hypothetical protein [Phototrophicaceae bacterium]